MVDAVLVMYLWTAVIAYGVIVLALIRKPIAAVAVAAGLMIAIVATKLVRGQRTAVGRAWTDQIEGFRTYIATAEA